MKKRLNISLWIFVFSFLISYPTFGQVSICKDKQSSHPVDYRISELRDSLKKTGIDTIIIYRHWLGKNGYNGYGKVVWIDKAKYLQLKIELENNGGNNEIKQSIVANLMSDSLFKFFIDNNIDTITTNPTEQRAYISHDAEHFVEVIYNDNSSCYLISGLLIRFNPDNLRVKFIKLLTDYK